MRQEQQRFPFTNISSATTRLINSLTEYDKGEIATLNVLALTHTIVRSQKSDLNIFFGLEELTISVDFRI